MPTIDEVPGAMERPGGCRIRVWQSEDGRETTLVIPPSPAPLWMIVALSVLIANLILVLATGLALFFGNHSILFMTQIAPKGLPVTMRRFAPWYAFGWAALLTLGVALLGQLMRPLRLRERLSVGASGVTIERRLWAGWTRQTVPFENVRGFRLERDPQGLVQSVLTVQGRGEEWAVGEGATEADREWLASVGTALLRAL